MNRENVYIVKKVITLTHNKNAKSVLVIVELVMKKDACLVIQFTWTIEMKTTVNVNYIIKQMIIPMSVNINHKC